MAVYAKDPHVIFKPRGEASFPVCWLKFNYCQLPDAGVAATIEFIFMLVVGVTA